LRDGLGSLGVRELGPVGADASGGPVLRGGGLTFLVDPRRTQDTAATADTAVAVLEWLCRDGDADTRWYVFCALSQETAGVPVQRVTAAADSLTDDPDYQVRDLALAYLSS
jgi:hypothetical protein